LNGVAGYTTQWCDTYDIYSRDKSGWEYDSCDRANYGCMMHDMGDGGMYADCDVTNDCFEGREQTIYVDDMGNWYGEFMDHDEDWGDYMEFEASCTFYEC